MPAHSSRKDKAEELRRLHHGPRMLLLLNAWDVISARLVEELGHPAVATSSAGIANCLGYPDSQRISRAEMLEMVQRIVQAVRVPVTADLESGYAGSPREMEETAQELLETGAVGLNLEDSQQGETRLIDLTLAVEKIEAVREAGAAAGVPLVINARTDAYWWKGAEPDTRTAETVRRAQAYRLAGADCIFIPGLKDPAEIAAFLRESPGPLNILGGAGVPPLPELQKLGVARVSLGSGPARAAAGMIRKIARELAETGTYASIIEGAIPYPEANRLLENLTTKDTEDHEGK